MKSRSSTTPCSPGNRTCLLAAAILAVVGCSVKPLPPPPDQAKPVPVAAEPDKPTILTLEYGNRSSKASIQIDLSGTDIQLEMTGSRDSLRRPVPPSVSPATQAPSSAQPVVVNVSQNPSRLAAPPDDSGTLLARRIVDSAAPKADPGMSDSTLRKVVQRIRRSQELFYAGRYPEAEDQVRRANELKATAEGLALAGSIAWVRKDKEGARRNWLAARELDPDFPGLSAVLEPEPVRQDPSR